MPATILCALLMGQTAAPPSAADGTDDALAAIRDETLRQRSRTMFELGGWGQANVVVSGLAFLAARTPFARGFELQLAAWGVGEATVAALNLIGLKRQRSELAGVDAWLGLQGQFRRHDRLEAAIDLGLLAGALAAWRFLRAPRRRGMAAGVALQCGFLAVFNLLASLVFGR